VERAIEDSLDECPRCGSNSVTTTIERDTFVYGTGADAAELSALVPVHTCSACRFEYTDAVAEESRHEAVCQHLGILAPRQIVGVRKYYRMTRAEFAGLTRFGEASLARWENGSILQNPANDQFLYLLQFPDNVQRLRERATGKATAVAEQPKVAERKFAAINIEQKRLEAKSFALNKSAAARSLCTW
jgi:DNA-binding transcriptional regulator YiaG